MKRPIKVNGGLESLKVLFLSAFSDFLFLVFDMFLGFEIESKKKKCSNSEFIKQKKTTPNFFKTVYLQFKKIKKKKKK